MRTILQSDLNGHRLIGTAHLPEPDGHEGAGRRVGVLLVNFAQAPRAGVGDISVWIGDNLAARGYPVFRFDLPGLGDSVGPAPEPGQALWYHIRSGQHAQTAATLIDYLRAEFGVEKLVIGGLCAGAVTALYLAAARRSEVAGAILLEPVFHRCDVRAGRGPAQPAGSCRIARRWLENAKRRVRRSLAGTRSERCVQLLYATLRRLSDLARGRRAPPDAILELMDAWRALIRHSVEILIINGGTDGREMYNRQYLGGSFARRATWKVVRESNHMLAAHGGKQAVSEIIHEWLEEKVTGEALPV